MSAWLQRVLIPKLVAALSGWGFPAFVISTLLEGALCSALLLIVPLQGTALGLFAQQFKVWCFGYDPRSGSMVGASVASFTLAPVLLAAFVLVVFWEPLAGALRRGARRMWPAPAAALVLLSAASGGLFWTSVTQAAQATVFPARELRTSLPAPAFALVDQASQPFSSSALRGQVTLATGFYSRCGTTCPMIMAEVQSAMAGLSEDERRQVHVIAITLDPRHDDPARLQALAKARGFEPLRYHLLTGSAADVDRALDAFSIARSRDPKTGVIDHSNVFVLLDRAGRVAYRLSLSPSRSSWLRDALRALLRDPVPHDA